MAQDYIMIRKQRSSDNYLLLLFFSQHAGTITIPLSNDDFSRLIKAGNAILGQHRVDEKIMMPDGWTASDYSNILDKVLSNSPEENYTPLKPEANVIIFIPDKRVDYSVTDLLIANATVFMHELGFALRSEEAPLYGSLYKRLNFVYAQAITNDELQKQYQKGREALEGKYTNSADEQTASLASAAEQLIKSLDGVKEGIIQLGTVMVMKKLVDGGTKNIIKQLQPEMALLLEKQPNMMLSFRAMYELLTGDIKGLPVRTDRPGSGS